jgi:aminoglycoside phosphotransferase (APT) family kinase protein
LVGCFTTEEAEKIILAVTANREALSEVNRPTLCHGDLWSGNLLVTEKEGVYHLAGIIDVDRAVYGDIDFDLGNPWMQLDDQLIQPQEGVNRQIRREIYAMMYSLFEAHVWHVQYCNQEISKNAKKTVLEKAEKLIQREEKTDQ